jgi:F-type H+-transporting ATPase subunit b
MRSNYSVDNSFAGVSALGVKSLGQTFRNCIGFSILFALAFGFFTLSVLNQSAMGDEEGKPAASDTKAEGDKSHSEPHSEGDSHAAGHGHDDLDNTHKDGSKGLESPDTIAADKTLFSVVVFILLLAGLYFLAWGPIMQGLAKREADINALIANAEKSSADASAKLREYELKLEVAAQEAQSMLAQARKDAEVAGQKIIGEAQAEAVRQKEQAVADIDSAKRVALSELSSKSTELAFTLAKRIVGRELRTEDHQQLVADVLKQFPSHN